MSRINPRSIVAGLVTVALTSLTATSCTVPGQAPQWRCANLMASTHTDLAEPKDQSKMRRLKSDGFNCISMVITLWSDNGQAGHVSTDFDTPTDSTLIRAASYARSIGLRPIFSIHNETRDYRWRAEINPFGANRTSWWHDELNFLVHYGAIAQRSAVPMYTLGSEMVGMASDYVHPTNGAYWRNTVIPRVAAVYHGLLTYDANWGGGSPFNAEVDHISFWNALNGPIMISAYYPIASAATWPALYKQRLAPLAAKWHRTIMFGEIGYWPAPGIGAHPWLSNTGGYSESTQASLYAWAMQFVAKYPETMAGLSWWNVTDGFTPLGRAAEQVIATAWGGKVPPGPAPAPE